MVTFCYLQKKGRVFGKERTPLKDKRMQLGTHSNFFFLHSKGRRKFSRATGPSVAAPQLLAGTRWNSVDVSGFKKKKKISLHFCFTKCEQRRCFHAPCGSHRGKSFHPSTFSLFFSTPWPGGRFCVPVVWRGVGVEEWGR